MGISRRGSESKTEGNVQAVETEELTLILAALGRHKFEPGGKNGGGVSKTDGNWVA